MPDQMTTGATVTPVPGGDGRPSANNGSGIAPPPVDRRAARATGNGRDAGGDIEATLGVGGAKRRGTALRRVVRWGVPIVAIVAIFVYYKIHHGSAPVRYATVAARRGDLAVTVTATGTLAALDTVDVGTEVSGVVDVVSADYNDRVTQGETLAVVNTDQLQAQIRQGEAALQAANATAQQTAATVAELRPQAVRAESLFAGKMVSQQDLEGAHAALARAVAADANAQAQIAASMAALASQRTVLAKATIRSPISGVVLQRQIEPGRTVAASFQTPVLFVLAADLKRMTLALDIDEADVGQVRAAQQAEFTVDAYPDRTFAASVRSVRNAAKTVGGVVTYQAILDVANPDLALRPGMTATAVVKTAQVHNVLLVPNAALRFTPASDSSAYATSGAPGTRGTTNRHQVWILRDGIPEAVAVSVGMTDGQWTEVTKGDITPGTALLTGVVDAKAVNDSSSARRPTGPLPVPRAR